MLFRSQEAREADFTSLVPQFAVRAFKAMGPAAVTATPALLDLIAASLKQPWEYNAEETNARLGAQGVLTREAERYIRRGLLDRCDTVQYALLDALNSREELIPLFVPELAEVVRTSDGVTVSVATDTLSRLPATPEVLVSHFQHIMRDRSATGDGRSQAIDKLAEAAHPPGDLMAELFGYLCDDGEDPTVREAAACRLPEDTPGLATELLRTFRNGSVATRLRGACLRRVVKIVPGQPPTEELLALMHDRGQDDPLRSTVVDVLVGHRGHEPPVLSAARHAIVDAGEHKDVRYAVLHAPSQVVRKLISPLRALLRAHSDDSWLRVEAAGALAKLGAEAAEALPDLLDLLHQPGRTDQPSEIRRCVLRAIREMGREQALEVLNEFEEIVRTEGGSASRGAAEFLVELKVEGQPLSALRRLTAHEELLDVRRAAIEALKEMGPEAVEALPELLIAARHEDHGVRSDAAKAISAIGRAAACSEEAVAAVARETSAWDYHVLMRLAEIRAELRCRGEL